MKEVLQFLQENPIFYLATVEENRPRVRPFGFVLEHEKRLYFATSNQKKVYRQLKDNPQFEISTTAKNGEWLRLNGQAVFNTTRAIKQAALDSSPILQKLYHADDSLLELFYIENGVATISDMSGASRSITL